MRGYFTLDLLIFDDLTRAEVFANYSYMTRGMTAKESQTGRSAAPQWMKWNYEN